jgi:hypothetical protein
MPERPRPDLDHTRDALRQHDERVAEDEEEEEREADDAAEESEDSGSDEDEGS